MKKSLGLFFFGIFAVATGIGCFSATFSNKNITKVEAASNVSYVEFDDDGIFKLGSYPQNVNKDLSADEIKNNGTLRETTLGSKYYIYQNKKYAIIENAVVDTENSADRSLSTGDLVDSYNGASNVVIEFNEIEWQLLKINKDDADTAFLISTRVLDRQIYNEYLSTHIAYSESFLSSYLNNTFKTMAFSDDDYKYLVGGEKGESKVEITIPTKTDVDLDTYQDKNLKQASDFAILNNLTSHSSVNHGVGVPYTNAGYWLDTLSTEQDRVDVCWAKVAVSHCLMDDPKIGIRPVIQVNYKENQGGGGGSTTPPKSSTTNSGNVTLGIGISFTILGAGGLIAFFIIWAKKHSSGKPPIWIIASLAGCLAISVVGLGCLAGGMNSGASDGSNCFYYGYYVQTGSYGSGQAAYNGWLIKSDGTASFSSRIFDKTNASDFDPDNYMTGTYKISGSKLVIDIPKHEINNFGTVGGTYTFTIKNCKYLYKGSTEAFHWVRGE